MKKRWTLTGLGFLLVAFFAAAPVRGDDVDQRIRSLEDELARLKSEQTQVKAEQIQLKKQATAAEAALPNFSYRPGSGMLIEAADKAWSFLASLEAHFRLLFESGLSESGRETGGVMGRRLRPEFYYCVNDCLYEIQIRLDLDGFGTGNGKNSTNTATSSILQRGTVWFHLEKFNPWLPSLYTGMDGEGAISSYRQGSSSTGSQLEYDLLSRNNGFNTGRWGNGFGLNWQDKDLSGIGIPGRIPLFNIVYASIGEGDDGLQSFREQRSVSTYINIEPLAQIKNKWIQGIGLEMGAWFCPNKPNHTPQVTQDIACAELRIRDNGDGGRQTLFRSSVTGSGMTHFLMPGFAWTVGPYRFRAVGGWQRYDGDNSNVQGRVWLFGHDLYIWSPKGFLTGDATTAGSILLGTHFERTDVSCPGPFSGAGISCNNGSTTAVATGPQQFHRDRILLREWDIWYVLMSRMSVGAAVAWYDASNVRQASTLAGANGIQSANNVARNLGCNSSHQTTLKRFGKGCDWTDVSVTWRYQF